MKTFQLYRALASVSWPVALLFWAPAAGLLGQQAPPEPAASPTPPPPPRIFEPPAVLDETHDYRVPPPQPPDGKWLKDEQGREYFIEKFEKVEGAYSRIAPNVVKLKFGTIVQIAKEDEKFFYGKIYRVDHMRPKPFAQLPKDPTAEELAAAAETYRFSWPSSDRLRFVTTAPDLPREGQWRNGFELVDLDGDGHLDLVHGTPRGLPGHPPFVFRGDGKGNLTFWDSSKFPRGPYDYGDVAVGDFNGDGHRDIACGMHVRGLLVLLGDGKGNFTMDFQGLPLEVGELQAGSSSTFSSRSIAALDWDGDGTDELLVLAEGPAGSFGSKGSSRFQQSYGIRLYKRSQDGVWQELPAGPVHRRLFGDALATGDIDGDGKLDFVAGTNAQSVTELLHFGRSGEASWESAPIPNLRPKAYIKALAMGDFDKDGRNDLAIGYINWELQVWRGGVDLFFSRPERSFERLTLYNEEGSFGLSALAAGDLDGDGNLDLVAGSTNGRIVVFLGNGKGGFSIEESSELEAEKGCQVYHLALGDLDRDGRADLVASFANEECSGQGRLQAWLTRPRR